MRFIHYLLLNAIGGLLAINAAIIWPYRHDLYLLWKDGLQWLALVSR